MQDNRQIKSGTNFVGVLLKYRHEAMQKQLFVCHRQDIGGRLVILPDTLERIFPILHFRDQRKRRSAIKVSPSL